MPETHTETDFDHILQLFTQYPCFHGIPEHAISELINDGSCLIFRPKEVIVHQDDWVDSIFLIVSGKAEVAIKKTSKFKKISLMPIAEMYAGTVIGLTAHGFYSASGKRTATVTSITDVHAIKIELKKLQQLLEQHPQHQTLHDTAYRFLKIKLIKEALPFFNITHERLIELSDKIQHRKLQKDEILFHEKDIGNECYLIVDGEISIFRKKNDEFVELAALKPPSVFGEATLVTNEPRNASAKAKTDCTLLEVKKEYLTELLETKENIEDTFMSLMINRSCPIKSADVEEYVQKNADQSMATIIKQLKNESYLKLSEEGTFIWNQLNGANTLKEITINHCKQFKTFAPQVVTSLISKLARSGFIQNLNFAPREEKPKTFRQKCVKKALHYLNYRKSFGDADRWLSKKYSRIRFLYKQKVLLTLGFFAFTGFILFLLNSDNIIELFEQKIIPPFLLLALVPLSLFSVIMHELGHAFAVKHFNRDVHYMGIAWNWLIPSAFTDTSDMWLAERKPRIIVNLSGIFNDLMLSSIAAWGIFIIPSPVVQAILWLFCLFTYISAFKNLNPMSESDGYYILIDWFDKPKLKDSAALWLGTLFKKKKSKSKKLSPELIYWLLCFFFLFGVVVITLFVQNFILRLLNLPESNPYAALIIPIITMVMTIVSAFKNQKKSADFF